MAKKNAKQVVEIKPCYYVYYDGKSGQILCVTNEVSNDYEFGIEVSSDEANKLISGEWNFKDYVIGHQKQANGTTVKCIIPNTDQEYAFRHNLFEWITENDKDDEFFVNWNLQQKCWRFGLRNQYKDAYEKEIAFPRFIFFITLQDDLDFLIRTIIIDREELMNADFVEYPFESTRETDIKSLSISTRVIFKSYRLYINYE